MSIDPKVEFLLPGHANIWLRQSTIDECEGPVMSSRDINRMSPHDYAYLNSDGMIRRYGEVIAEFSNLQKVTNVSK